MLFEDLLLEYGNVFLIEEQGGDEIISMDRFGRYLLTKTTAQAFSLGAFSYGYFGGSFDFSAAYFIEDGAGNVASIEQHQVLRYFDSVISHRDFIDWLYENNYIAEWQFYDLQDDVL